MDNLFCLMLQKMRSFLLNFLLYTALMLQKGQKLSKMADTNSTPRVLVIDLSHEFGGSSTRALGVVSALGREAALAAVRNSPVFLHATQMGLEVYAVGNNKTDWHILPSLLNLIKTGKFKVLDTQNIQSKFWGSLAAFFSGSALVSTLNSWYFFEHGGNWKGRLYTWLELLTNFGLDGYITVSQAVRDVARKAAANAPFVDLIYNAVQISAEEIEGSGKTLKRRFGFGEEALLCTAVGRLVWAKGYEDLIEAMRLVTEKNSSAQVLIVGEGDLRPALEAQIARYGLGGRIRLAGYQDRASVLSILRGSDIFVMPSRQEGTPIALLEAGAMGLPILTTTSGGIPELVEDGEQALLVPPKDPQALAGKLLQLLENPPLRATLGAKAREQVHARFGIQAQAEATRQAYQKAWQHKHPQSNP